MQQENYSVHPLALCYLCWGSGEKEGNTIFLGHTLLLASHRQSPVCLWSLHSQVRPLRNLLSVSANYWRRQSNIPALGNPETLQTGSSHHGRQQMLILLYAHGLQHWQGSPLAWS